MAIMQRPASKRLLVYLLGLSFALTPMPGAGQTNMPAMEMRDQVPPADLPVPRKLTGIGNSHLEITASPEAQMWFDQGLNLLHDFWDYESARAFEQAVRVDPKCAMCYWGLYEAESFGHSNSQGYAGQALAMAAKLENGATEHERCYIDATRAREDALHSQNSKDLFGHARDLWQQLVAQYPDDLQARIFLEQEGGVPQAKALELLESVIHDHPDDSAANHYYIHALEASDHPERALRSAEILASLAPASGHMVHMPGHIFFRVGDYKRAEQAFAASMAVDEAYMREQQVSADNDWNYVHNLMYAVANLLEEGKFREATALSAKLSGARGELQSTLYIYSWRDSIARLEPRLPVALRTADWPRVERLLKTFRPAPSQPNLAFLARELGLFARVMRALDAHDVPAAEKSFAEFDTGMQRMSEVAKKSLAMQTAMTANSSLSGPPKIAVKPDALVFPIVGTLNVMEIELRASLAAARSESEQARKFFADAIEAEKELGYHEPPNYIRPVGETEGAAMLARGDWMHAMEAYKQALSERPRSGFALYGIALTSEKSGDVAAASGEYAEFLDAWREADPDLARIKHARTWLARHKSGG